MSELDNASIINESHIDSIFSINKDEHGLWINLGYSDDNILDWNAENYASFFNSIVNKIDAHFSFSVEGDMGHDCEFPLTYKNGYLYTDISDGGGVKQDCVKMQITDSLMERLKNLLNIPIMQIEHDYSACYSGTPDPNAEPMGGGLMNLISHNAVDEYLTGKTPIERRPKGLIDLIKYGNCDYYLTGQPAFI